MHDNWPEEFPVRRIRIARQTDRLAKVIEFYCQGLGLQQIGNFNNHSGYDGVMIGLPNWDTHLEFVQHQQGSPGEAPTRENLLVLYLPSSRVIRAKTEHLERMGYPAVEPENPYWNGKSITIEDPDGWRVVLFNLDWENDEL